MSTFFKAEKNYAGTFMLIGISTAPLCRGRSGRVRSGVGLILSSIASGKMRRIIVMRFLKLDFVNVGQSTLNLLRMLLEFVRASPNSKH